MEDAFLMWLLMKPAGHLRAAYIHPKEKQAHWCMHTEPTQSTSSPSRERKALEGAHSCHLVFGGVYTQGSPSPYDRNVKELPKSIRYLKKTKSMRKTLGYTTDF